MTPGDTDDADARPAFVGVVDGKEGLRFRVVNRINDGAYEIPDQCGPFYPHLDSHTVFQCLISEPAWHLHGPGNLPKNDFQYTIRVLDDSEDLGGTAMAADHTPTAITIDPVRADGDQHRLLQRRGGHDGHLGRGERERRHLYQGRLQREHGAQVAATNGQQRAPALQLRHRRLDHGHAVRCGGHVRDA